MSRILTVTASTTSNSELKKLGLRKGQPLNNSKVAGISYVYSNIETLGADGLDKGFRYTMVDLKNGQRVDWYTLSYYDTASADHQAIQHEWNHARILGKSPWITWDSATVLEAGKEGWTITELRA